MYTTTISHANGYSCDVELRDFNAPIRFYFKTPSQRKIFSDLIQRYNRVEVIKGRPIRVTHYDLDATRMNVVYYFGEIIAEQVYPRISI